MRHHKDKKDAGCRKKEIFIRTSRKFRPYKKPGTNCKRILVCMKADSPPCGSRPEKLQNILSMVEQTDARKRHSDSILVASLYHMVIADRTSGLSNVFYSTLVRPLNVIAEREEGIRA